MNIRLATLTDIPKIMLLIKEVVPIMRESGNLQWDDTYPNPAVFENDIALGQLWVAEVNSHIAGVSAITTEQYPEYAEVGLDINEVAVVTHRLAVSPRFRGQGIAAALMLQAEEVARQLQIDVLRVDTNTQNLATQKLFPKMGYEFKGEMNLKFRPGLKFVCFEKRLPTQNIS
ncbi:GNAT family N-acetyltransferase [Mucilaginibacter litoreus]|uniref:GNAT family N-acetyltransferase n=1 Tax=Mucilaginibacter litoreus TaxID=1048221 RepID=A0ABW3APL9_9SPHI